MYKVAQYGQWDGYPSGQGSTALKFLHSLDKASLVAFRDKVRALKEISPEEYKAKWVECGADPDEDMVSMDVSDKFKKRYPHLQRDMGAEILSYIMMKSDPGLKLQKEIEFAADSLFCEYAYVIDLDKGVFEIYMGHNCIPLKEGDRFFFLEKLSQKDHRTTQYHPVRLIKTYKLSRLPKEKTFVKVCDRECEAIMVLDDIKASGSVEIPACSSSVQALKEIFAVPKNLPLLMGISKDLDAKVARKLKSKHLETKKL